MEASSPITMPPNQNILLGEHRKITKITEMKGKLLGGFFVLLYMWFAKIYVVYSANVYTSNFGSTIKPDI